MQLIINGQDYSAAFDAAHPLKVERTLNAPSTCSLSLLLPADGTLALPARMQPIVLSGDNGVALFTGFLAADPLPEFAGSAMEGPRFRYVVQAISDEMLLDQALPISSRQISGQSAGPLLKTLAAHTGATALATDGLTLNAPVPQLVPAPGAPFSKTAGRVANQVRAAYRAASGALTLTAIPAAVHMLSETDGTLTLSNLSLAANPARTAVTDVTLCGEHEPAAYVTEIFQGDGVTTQFYLSNAPFFPSSASSRLIDEQFDGTAIDATRWNLASAGSYFALGAHGLALGGGTGVDGQALLSWIDPVEMGGTLLLEAVGVSLQTASTGILAAFFSGQTTASGCIAGFQATAQQTTGAVSLQPLILDSPSGLVFNLSPDNQYTLRIRIHCAEVQRTLATYLAGGESGILRAGGQSGTLPAHVHCELQEFVNGVAGVPVTLYDGSLNLMPAACSVVAAGSLNLNGSLRALRLIRLGTGWVISTPTTGGSFTRRLGNLPESAECQLDRGGKLVFYAGYIPADGEQIAVTYRTAARSTGRAMQPSASTVAWTGTVTYPPARSSADCRNAAAVLLETASGASARQSGSYRTTSLELGADVWPGDALSVAAPSCCLNAVLVVRKVTLIVQPTLPALVEYNIQFANDWAEDLAIHTSSAVPEDAWLPALAPFTPLPNLAGLSVTSVSGSAVTINTGSVPPDGGGFEVRRRDYDFHAGEDPGLVMRASVSNLTFARESANDRFYIRAYDGANPPNYSEFSAAVFINLPLGA